MMRAASWLKKNKPIKAHTTMLRPKSRSVERRGKRVILPGNLSQYRRAFSGGRIRRAVNDYIGIEP